MVRSYSIPIGITIFSGEIVNHDVEELNLGVSLNGATPSHHPFIDFIDGIFHYKYYQPSSYWGTPMTMETLPVFFWPFFVKIPRHQGPGTGARARYLGFQLPPGLKPSKKELVSLEHPMKNGWWLRKTYIFVRKTLRLKMPFGQRFGVLSQLLSEL